MKEYDHCPNCGTPLRDCTFVTYSLRGDFDSMPREIREWASWIVEGFREERYVTYAFCGQHNWMLSAKQACELPAAGRVTA